MLKTMQASETDIKTVHQHVLRPHQRDNLQRAYIIERVLPSYVMFVHLYLLQAFSNVIFRTAVQQLTRLQRTQCIARSVYDSRVSCN